MLVSAAVGGYTVLSDASVLKLWQLMFGERGRDCVADLRFSSLRRLCDPHGSREFDTKLQHWLRCHERNFSACCFQSVDDGECSDDDQD
jgi:hypothetical protein